MMCYQAAACTDSLLLEGLASCVTVAGSLHANILTLANRRFMMQP